MKQLTIGLAAVMVLVLGQTCHAGEVVLFTLDPALSYLTVSGTYSGFEFGEQAAGSMTCNFGGTIVADENAGTLTFSGGSTILALANPAGPFLPAPVAIGIIDNFGFNVSSPLGNIADGVFRDVRMDIASGTVTDGALPNGMGISIPYYVFAYEVYDTFFTDPDWDESVESDGARPNTSDQVATLTTVGNVQTLTIPILRSTATGEDPAIVFVGQFVGTRTVISSSLTVNDADVVTDEGGTATNGGSVTSADPITLTASLGTATNNGDGTWSWSYDAADDRAETVVITATNAVGGSSQVTFDLTVLNVDPAVTVDQAGIAVNLGSTATNSVVVSDVPADVIALTASLGTVTDNGNGTWSWSYDALNDMPDTVVTVTATDDDGGIGQVTFGLTTLTSEELLVDVIDYVSDLNLASGIENNLDAKLQNALDALEASNAGQRNDAINKLEAFINAVAAQAGKSLTQEQARELTNAALEIIAMLI